MSRKREVITFKVDETLAEVLRDLPNRSDFIRTAILNAMDNTCPLCHGAGILSLEQRNHWDAFAASHGIEKCNECHATHLVCKK